MILIALVLLLAQQAPAADEDWEYAAAEGASSIATIGFADGLALNVTCYAPDILVVNFAGIPVQQGERLTATAQRADGRALDMPLRAGRDGVLGASSVERAARFLRGGGELSMRVERADGPPLRIKVDLPRRHDNLDRVIEHCGRRLSEPRDALPELVDLRSMPNVVLDLPRRPRRPQGLWSQARISCLVTSDARLADCQTEHEHPADRGFGDIASRSYNGARVDVLDPAAAAGRVLIIDVNGPAHRP